MSHVMTPPPSWGRKRKTTTYSNLKHSRGFHVTSSNFFTAAAAAAGQSARGVRGQLGRSNPTKPKRSKGTKQQRRWVKESQKGQAKRVSIASAAAADPAPLANVQKPSTNQHSRAVRRLHTTEAGRGTAADGRRAAEKPRRRCKLKRSRGKSDASRGDPVAATATPVRDHKLLCQIHSLQVKQRAAYAAAHDSLRTDQRRLLEAFGVIEDGMASVTAQLTADIENLNQAVGAYAKRSDEAFEQSSIITPHAATLGPEFEALHCALGALPRDANGDVLL